MYMTINPINMDFQLDTNIEVPETKKVRFKRMPQVIRFQQIEDRVLVTMTPVKPDLVPNSPLYSAIVIESPKNKENICQLR